ncbi:U4 U6.U5 tri-snRNP-associated protein [Dimargaris verticillata]|uniref:U4 U6.U5 tri-snRNP-associated protein n=1 Tax=Dimargaris verticillata TaxID=2761393 RepID=A0A9W8B5X8_9FUNG|nr:U4 U6.U5 tri-snRNP-associated protein [Dimargaris verticillata]
MPPAPTKRRKTVPASDDEHPQSDVLTTHAPAMCSSPSALSTTTASSQPQVAYQYLYLDTIDRTKLDFDFDKVCSVSLAKENVYACLVCGRYFQGRGRSTYAYFHSINEGHHVFINLETHKVYVLPDGYEVVDASLNDIKHVVDPRFTANDIVQVDTMVKPSLDVHRKPYLPGYIGVNNIKANDYVNVVIQALAHVTPLYHYFLQTAPAVVPASPSLAVDLVQQFSLFVRKLWNPRAFKAQVAPHELLQAIGKASANKFKVDVQADAAEFLSWLLNTLHRGLGGTKKSNSSIIYQTFRGAIQVTTDPAPSATTGSAKDTNTDSTVATKPMPMLLLSLDLPPAPLFQDEQERNILPQVPLTELLAKFDGRTPVQTATGAWQRYQILSLPRYLIIVIKRFARSNFSLEKNPTVVSFPITDLNMGELTHMTDSAGQPVDCFYDLVANISHSGKPGTPQSSYHIHVRNPAKDEWYQIQDLLVDIVDPQRLFLSESYIQV